MAQLKTTEFEDGLRADFTNSGQLAGLLNADYFKPVAKSDSRFTNKSELLPNSGLVSSLQVHM